MSFVPIRQGGQCWIWNGGCYTNDYGAFSIEGISHYAHRVSYEIHYGTIPFGSLVLHKCDVKRCVNPDHLELGDHSKNIQDRFKRIKDSKRGYRISMFTVEDTYEIKYLRSTGITFDALGKLFKCDAKTIFNIVNNKVTHFKGESK
jgi:hypothetical protein